MSDAPIWVTLVVGLGAGTFGNLLGAWQGRKVLPAQRVQLEADAAQKRADAEQRKIDGLHTAVQTVEEALNVARGRIESLQSQVTGLTTQIGELHAQLDMAKGDRNRIGEALNIALTERAKLEQQIMDLNRRVGARRVADLAGISPPDAIVMVSLETGKIDYANEGVYSLLGYVPSQVVGEPIEFLVPEGRRTVHTKERTEFGHDPKQRSMGKGLPLYARPNGGGQIPVDISLHPTGDGRVIALVKRRDEAVAGTVGDIAKTVRSSV